MPARHTPSEPLYCVEGPSVSAAGMSRAELLRRAGVVATGATLAGLAAACNSSSASSGSTSAGSLQKGGTIQLATDQLFEGDSLDPIKAVNDGQGFAQGMLREGLATLDLNQRPVPRLTSWDANPKFTEYTLHCRRGVTFHSGKPFTADDASWTILRALDPKQGSQIQARLATSLDPSGVKVVDGSTVRLTLKQPDSDIMNPLGRTVSYVCPANTTNFEDGDGTGPFKLQSWNAGQSFAVVKNPHYWQSGVPYVDAVHGIQIADPSTLTESIMSGQSHMGEIAYQSLPLIRGNTAVKQHLLENFHMLNVAMDQTQKPFTDPNVREAMKRALDRNKLMQVAFAGYATVTADTPSPSVDPQFPSSLMARTKQNLQQSEQLMKTAGYPNGLTLTLPTPSDTLHATFALAFAAALSGSPFTINVEQHPPDTYWDKIWLNAAFFVSDWNRRFPLEALSQQLSSKSTQNEPKFHSPQLDSLIAKGFGSSGSEQDATVGEALTLVSENSGDVIPAYRHRIIVAKNSVQALGISTVDVYDLRRTWLS